MEKKGTNGKQRLQEELCTNVVTGGKKYLVLTEELPKKHIVITKVYLGGEIILTKKTDCKYVLNTPEPEKRLKELMHNQHEMAVNKLKAEKKKEMKALSYYLDEVKNLLKRNNHKDALKVLFSALKQYPNEPFFLSYYGCLDAIVNKNYTDGIDNCLRAIDILNEKVPFGHEFFYPLFYLNLGRAYLSGGNKKKAIKVFHTGLAYDKENKDLLWEIKKLGIRRKPVVPFLPRSNLINKHIGLLLHKLYKPTPRVK